MSLYFHTLPFSGNASTLFKVFYSYFHEKGFHIEEADAITLRLHAEKTRGILSSLFGLGTFHVFVSFSQGGSVQIRLSHPAPSLMSDLKAILDATAVQTPLDPQPTLSTAPTTIIVREIVRIPCRFCGSLVDNTQPRCPYCGGEIR